MSRAQNYQLQGGGTIHDYQWPSLTRDHMGMGMGSSIASLSTNNHYNSYGSYDGCQHFYNNFRENGNQVNYLQPPDSVQSLKRRKFSASTWADGGGSTVRYLPAVTTKEAAAPSMYKNNTISLPFARTNEEASTVTVGCGKRDRSQLEDDEPVFMSRRELERYSPSRKHGIDATRESYLRFTYCTFIQTLGFRLELPQTTIGTAMVLCHRFFVRRSHACHDRFVVATAAVFLAAKYEENPRPLNNVVRFSCEIYHKQDVTSLSYVLPVDWFEQYRERVLEAEQMILTTLNFEINVEHPYAPLKSILKELGLSQTVLVNLALNLISGGLRSSLWLQFKPHHIAAGAVYLAATFLNWDPSSYRDKWPEFHTSSTVIQDVAQQLMELVEDNSRIR